MLMAVTKAEIEIGRRLFVEGWGGDTPEAPLQFMTKDCVMRDIVGHAEAMRGHQAIVDFWGKSAGHLKVPPEEIFVSDDGVALTWMAYVRIRDDSRGKENVGKWICGEGMSRLEFRDGLVCLEIDYWAGPQGMCDDWEAHFNARQALSRAELGAITGGNMKGL
jgi:hypothetical protein